MATTQRAGGRYKRRDYKRRTRKEVPWAGWAKIAPKQGRERDSMLRDCGRRCFLGPRSRPKSFPICAKGTCKRNMKGTYAAYIRAREWGKPRSDYHGLARPTMRQRDYQDVARKAKRILERDFGKRVGRGGGRWHTRRHLKKSPKGTHRRIEGQVRRHGRIVRHGRLSTRCYRK